MFDSIVMSFGTAGTGGFGIYADSVGGFNIYSQVVIAVFMMIFGINFNLYYLAIVGKVKQVISTPLGRAVSERLCTACGGEGKIIKEPWWHQSYEKSS